MDGYLHALADTMDQQLRIRRYSQGKYKPDIQFDSLVYFVLLYVQAKSCSIAGKTELMRKDHPFTHVAAVPRQ